MSIIAWLSYDEDVKSTVYAIASEISRNESRIHRDPSQLSKSALCPVLQT